MGIGISNWRLAREVARHGGLGVVSGTAINSLMIRRLQDGDPEGHVRRALSRFPFPSIATRILEKYFVEGGIPRGTPYKRSPMYTLNADPELDALTVASNFVEVHLAKEGHDGVVGVNFLEKIQMPHLASLYGVMLAGVDYVLMGAGIPRDIPGILDAYARNAAASLKIWVENAEAGAYKKYFDPQAFAGGEPLPTLKRPKFLAIVSSAILARSLATKASGRIDGFIVETPTAGGHNAPPRGALQLNERGEPIYGVKDAVNFKEMASLGVPFWLAGSYGSPEGLMDAIASGAHGIQVGTAFAYSREAGMVESLRKIVWEKIKQAAAPRSLVFTDPLASPTGMPFKVVEADGTISENDVYAARPRKCDLGYLRDPALTADGKIVYKCASEPVEVYVKKGGRREDTNGRKCLCNALMATVGHAQHQESGYVEAPLITSGDDVGVLKRLLADKSNWFTAADVLEFLLAPLQKGVLKPAASVQAAF
jgi:NAD(P)H-dependent flavin oxidoreductase YrpB (nitropropane dioxygenase family)